MGNGRLVLKHGGRWDFRRTTLKIGARWEFGPPKTGGTEINTPATTPPATHPLSAFPRTYLYPVAA